MIEILWLNMEIIITVIQAFIIGKFLVDFNEFSLKSRTNKTYFLIINPPIKY